MNWFTSSFIRIVEIIRKNISKNREFKKELKQIERRAYVQEKKNIAERVGRQKAQGKYKSPFTRFLMGNPKKGKLKTGKSKLKTPEELLFG